MKKSIEEQRCDDIATIRQLIALVDQEIAEITQKLSELNIQKGASLNQ